MNVTEPQTDLIARGTLEQSGESQIVLALPGTDYKLHLEVDSRLPVQQGKRVAGQVHARAMRVDVVTTGGRYIEPVYGRPRRVQGRIAAVDPAQNTITVLCPLPVVCKLTAPNQTASAFKPDMLVSFNVERGTKFELGPR